MAKIILKGITWGHSRGITPLLAFSQRFAELNPGVEVAWTKRSLQEFADFPIEKLTEQYDLLIIDHPWVGCADATGCVLPLEEYLSKEYLADQETNSVGQSHLSYNYNGHQWALAIDAATPAASYRPDLFQRNNIEIPSTWEDVIKLASDGKVALPAIPIDTLMNFYMFCIAHGSIPFHDEEKVVDDQTGVAVLETMKQLYDKIDRSFFARNPIAVAEIMSTTDDFWYCPFAYCYSNYARQGFSKNVLHYADLVTLNSKKLQSTIGGTGIAVSAFTRYPDLAVRFAEQVVAPSCQSTIYVEHGGQPGHRSAWLNENANRLSNNFFKIVLPAMDRGYVRPRYNGYLYFQDHAGEVLHGYLLNGGDKQKVLTEMNALYQKSLTTNNVNIHE